MEIPPQIPNSPNKCVRPVEKPPQISKLPNKRARDRDANYNPYDHNPNAHKSDSFRWTDRDKS